MFENLFRKKAISKIVKDAEAGLGDVEHGGGKLNKVLGIRDLTAMGVAALVGAGIFSTIGEASFNGGPGISLLFVITAITCGFTALCYAEFASRVPIAGSAYTYSYVSFGELAAWVIGWALIMEYAIGNIVVAISWSGYFYNLLHGFGVEMPAWMTMDHKTAKDMYNEVQGMVSGGTALSTVNDRLMLGYHAYTQAPIIGGIRMLMNLPAFLIVALVTWIVYIGVQESKRVTNWMVGIKMLIIFMVIVVGFFYVTPENWTPFMPNGFSGVMKGVSAVFFAYIGFDAISTTAEEAKNPQRDVPRSMIYSLIICTIFYILIALVLTGMVNFSELKVSDPLAFVFERVGLHKISYIISVSAVVATTSVILVFQLGQPRIWMSMSRDGLLPKPFSRIHPRYKTPSFATIVTGFFVGIPALFLDMTLVTDLTSIGTLFAFILVCGGVLMLPRQDPAVEGQPKHFRLPYINGKFILPIILGVFIYLFHTDLADKLSLSGGWDEWKHNIPFFAFVIAALLLTVFTVLKNFSLIPLLGLLSCFYLMSELGFYNWVLFGIWLVIGLVIYFLYGYNHSKLRAEAK